MASICIVSYAERQLQFYVNLALSVSAALRQWSYSVVLWTMTICGVHAILLILVRIGG